MRGMDLSGFYISLFSLLIGLGLGTLVILAHRINPIEAYIIMIDGALGSPYRFGETLVRATPFMLAGLGVAYGFKGGFWNIGAEGQILIGALAAVWAGFTFENLPSFLHISVCFISAFICAGLWCSFSGILKAKFGVNEVLTTLMMNYIAFWITHFATHYIWKDPGIFNPQTNPILLTAKLPIILPRSRVHFGFVVALIIAILIYFVFTRTTIGYNLKAVGSNPRASNYIGINLFKTIIITSFISGALAGLAGWGEVNGLYGYVEDNITPNFGYIAIAVAMLGGLKPLGIILSALILGFLMSGSNYMQRGVGMPTTSVHVFIGLIVISMLLAPLIKKYIIKKESFIS